MDEISEIEEAPMRKARELYKVTTATGTETQMRFTPEEAKNYEAQNPGSKVSGSGTPTAVQARNKGRTTAKNTARKPSRKKATARKKTTRKKATAKKTTTRKTAQRRRAR